MIFFLITSKLDETEEHRVRQQPEPDIVAYHKRRRDRPPPADNISRTTTIKERRREKKKSTKNIKNDSSMLLVSIYNKYSVVYRYPGDHRQKNQSQRGFHRGDLHHR